MQLPKLLTSIEERPKATTKILGSGYSNSQTYVYRRFGINASKSEKYHAAIGICLETGFKESPTSGPRSTYTTFFKYREVVCSALQDLMPSYQDPTLIIVVKWEIWIDALKSRLNGIIR